MRLTSLLDGAGHPSALTSSSTRRVETPPIGLLDHREQRPLGSSPRFQQAREIAPVADGQACRCVHLELVALLHQVWGHQQA